MTEVAQVKKEKVAGNLSGKEVQERIDNLVYENAIQRAYQHDVIGAYIMATMAATHPWPLLTKLKEMISLEATHDFLDSSIFTVAAESLTRMFPNKDQPFDLNIPTLWFGFSTYPSIPSLPSSLFGKDELIDDFAKKACAKLLHGAELYQKLDRGFATVSHVSLGSTEEFQNPSSAFHSQALKLSKVLETSYEEFHTQAEFLKSAMEKDNSENTMESLTDSLSQMSEEDRPFYREASNVLRKYSNTGSQVFEQVQEKYTGKLPMATHKDDNKEWNVNRSKYLWDIKFLVTLTPKEDKITKTHLMQSMVARQLDALCIDSVFHANGNKVWIMSFVKLRLNADSVSSFLECPRVVYKNGERSHPRST